MELKLGADLNEIERHSRLHVLTWMKILQIWLQHLYKTQNYAIILNLNNFRTAVHVKNVQDSKEYKYKLSEKMRF